MQPIVMQKTQVRSLGWEDPLEKEMAAHSSILAWKNPMDLGAWQATVHGVAKSQTRLCDFTSRFKGQMHLAVSASYTAFSNAVSKALKKQLEWEV